MKPFKENGSLEQHKELKCGTPSPRKSPCFIHSTTQQVSSIYRGTLFSLYLLLQIQVLVAGALEVQGPREPVVAILGEIAELPCFLSPSQNARSMQIRWSRSLNSDVVHLYKNGRDQPKETMETYKGRTELKKNAISKGLIALRIHKVRLSDNGKYYCQFQRSSLYNYTVIELKVAVMGSDPHFSINVTKSRDIELECKSRGWFPEPKMQWIDSQQGLIPSVSENQTQDQSGLFHSSILLLVTETLQRNVTCSVWNPVLNLVKEGQLSIAVSEPPSSSSSFITEHIILWGITVVILLTLLIGICLCKKVCQQQLPCMRSTRANQDGQGFDLQHLSGSQRLAGVTSERRARRAASERRAQRMSSKYWAPPGMAQKPNK